MDTRLAELNRTDLQHHQATDLMRALSAQWFGGGAPAEYFAERWPQAVHRDLVTKHFETLYTKAAVAPTDSVSAAPLMAPGLLRGFLPLVKATSVLGQLPLTPAPFNVKIAKQITGSSSAWVGENVPKPISKLGFGSITLPWSKTASIVVVTEELLKLTQPGSNEQLQQTLRDEMVIFTDKEFLSTTAATPAVRPAGILNGVTPVTPSADLKLLVNTFFTNKPYPLGPYVVLSPAVAAKVAVLDIGRDVTVNGGTLLGLPVVTTPAAAANAIVLDAPGIYLADGGINFNASQDALIEMVDTTTNPPVAATVYHSCWQTNTIAVLCERFVCWVVAASNAVQYLVVA